MASFRLLTTANAKLLKGQSYGWVSYVLHLAPHNLSGHNVCAMATKGCREACLNTAGRGGMVTGMKMTEWNVDDIRSGNVSNHVQAARIRRTRRFFDDREGFLADLVRDVNRVKSHARRLRMRPVIRLNGTSDVKWENIPVIHNGREYPNIFTAFPRIHFYDYTKNPFRDNLPKNYRLVFSAADGNDEHVAIAMDKGWNVAVVFRGKLPETYLGRPVVNGDQHDLRHIEDGGIVIGLKAKGRARYDRSGFVKEAA